MIGIDIGGANLKFATTDNQSGSIGFPLWQKKQNLSDALRRLLVDVNVRDDAIAVTMTGELADCFDSKSEGVRFIVNSVESAFPKTRTLYYQVGGDFVSASDAVANWGLTAAANWYGLAQFIACRFDTVVGSVVDIGSTTTDIVRFKNGQVESSATNDFDRLRTGELVYTGAWRSPVCSIVKDVVVGRNIPVAKELFATVADVYLLTGHYQEDADCLDTADGRPFTIQCSRQRLAKMLCCDHKELSEEDLLNVAGQVEHAHKIEIQNALSSRIANGDTVILSGQGEFLARVIAADMFPDSSLISLKEELGVEVSKVAPAYAIAWLAKQSSKLSCL